MPDSFPLSRRWGLGTRQETEQQVQQQLDKGGSPAGSEAVGHFWYGTIVRF